MPLAEMSPPPVGPALRCGSCSNGSVFAMPIYFFHQQTGNDLLEDTEGSDLADLEAARSYALEGMREMLGSSIRWKLTAPDRIIVADDSGRQLLSVAATEVLPDTIKRLLRD